jgi:catechol 2,3-dioxygenase-like lactoylglutathione lyase family enzyme
VRERIALVPELSVSDLSASLSFYVGLLGFRIEYDRPEERFAALSFGAAHIMLEEAPLSSARPPRSSGGASGARPIWRSPSAEV